MGRGVPALLATLVLACAAGNPPPEPQPVAPAAPIRALPMPLPARRATTSSTFSRAHAAAAPSRPAAQSRRDAVCAYERSCVARLTLPGTSWTAERFEACAADGRCFRATRPSVPRRASSFPEASPRGAVPRRRPVCEHSLPEDVRERARAGHGRFPRVVPAPRQAQGARRAPATRRGGASTGQSARASEARPCARP